MLPCRAILPPSGLAQERPKSDPEPPGDQNRTPTSRNSLNSKRNLKGRLFQNASSESELPIRFGREARGGAGGCPPRPRTAARRDYSCIILALLSHYCRITLEVLSPVVSLPRNLAAERACPGKGLGLCTSCVVESGWRHSSLYTTYMNSASAQWVPIPLAPKLPSCSATLCTPASSGYQSHRRSRRWL